MNAARARARAYLRPRLRLARRASLAQSLDRIKRIIKERNVRLLRDMDARDVFLSINANLVSSLPAFRRGTPSRMRAGFHQEIARHMWQELVIDKDVSV